MDLGSLSSPPKLCLKFKYEGILKMQIAFLVCILPKPSAALLTFLVWEHLHHATTNWRMKTKLIAVNLMV